MGRLSIRNLGFFVMIAIIASSCALSKMANNANDIRYDVTPSPLEVHGDSVAITIGAKFPKDYFNPNVTVNATPVLEYGNDSTTFKSVTFVGEDVEGSGVVVPQAEGKDYNYNSTIAYDPAMKESKLKLLVDGQKGNNSEKFKTFSLAEGVITTPYLMEDDDKLLWGKDHFKRTKVKQYDSRINFQKNKSYVRRSEKREDDIERLDSLLQAISEHEDLELRKMNVDGYASPEGEITFNQNLTEERANAAIDVVMGFLNDHDFDVNKEEFFSKTSQGEDWEGFKEMMMASTIKDKEMIIQYLKKYDDVVKREEKIRELSVAFEELREQILPELRRSKMTLHYAKTGLSNKELKDLAMSNPDSLELEEMLKAATLFSDHDDKLTVYKAAANQYPNDWRAHNNVGVIHMKKENMSKAIARFDKAIKVGDSPIPHNNRGVAARLKDNRDKALTHYEKAEGAGPEVGYNTGLVHIQNGNYKKAVLNMSELNTINTGLANLLNEDYKRAKQALNNADKSNAALAHYLRAIVGARTNNASMLTNNLEKAVRKNSSYSEKARNDLEFKEFFGTSEFESALGSS